MVYGRTKGLWNVWEKCDKRLVMTKDDVNRHVKMYITQVYEYTTGVSNKTVE